MGFDNDAKQWGETKLKGINEYPNLEICSIGVRD